MKIEEKKSFPSASESISIDAEAELLNVRFARSQEVLRRLIDLGLSENDADFIIKELVNALPNLINTSDSFENLVNKVKSPNGTTEAGINSLNEDSFDKIIKNAIQKSANRSNEISEELKRE